MKRQLLLTLMAVVMVLCATAQTNAPSPRIEELKKRIESSPTPVRLTPEEDNLLVAAGVLPPADKSVAPTTTFEMAPPESRGVEMRFENAPLALVAQVYAKLIGKTVLVADGLTVGISCCSTGNFNKVEAAAIVRRSLDAQALQVRTVDVETVRIERRNSSTMRAHKLPRQRRIRFR